MLPIDTRSSQRDADEQHERGTKWPVAWFAKALQLKRAYEKLQIVALADFDDLMNDRERAGESVAGVVLMLGGLTIENLLKGLIAKQGQVPESQGRPKFSEHKLNNLARDANVGLSADESILLQRLTEFVLWAGRYPAPQIPTPLRGHTLPNGGFGGLTSISAPTDFSDTSAMIDRLHALLVA